MSNAVTKVNICGQEMTVAEAIETKSSIKNYKNLLANLKRQYSECNRQVENTNQSVRNRLNDKYTRNGGMTN